MDELSTNMINGLIPFPYKRNFMPNPEELFNNLIKNDYVRYDYNSRVQSTRKNIKWEFDGVNVSIIINGRAYDEVDQLTDYFTEEARMKSNVKGSIKPIKAWRDPIMAKEIAACAMELLHKDMDKYKDHRMKLSKFHLREASYFKIPECTLFKISLAKGIYQFFNAKIVLDPFGGWGDRAFGAAGAGVLKYVGIDPNPSLIKGHEKITKFLSEADDSCTEIKYRHIPIEEYGINEFHYDFRGNPPDLIFSSPPFYDYETYNNNDDKQSIKKYDSLKKWTYEWLLPSIDQLWDYLAPEGNLALYFTDRNGEVLNPLKKHMKKKHRHFRGVIACRRGRKRPIPLWVWQK